ncbi:MAG TPA: rhodanese-like domain-containing protein [Polyangiaceae bacterium]|jgi:rhodanese-related sulfurtransferase|nr:rhodanese-like domain-containing protein [Polyangiaceae bacterium]
MIVKLATVIALSSCAAFGCQSSRSSDAAPAAAAAAPAPAIQQVTIAQVAGFVKDKNALIFDANGGDTRAEYGVIPGAVLLTSHDDYPLSELPADKSEKLVFYCGGTACRASDAAAARASSAGHTDVNILRDGITGWKRSGQPTDTPRS